VPNPGCLFIGHGPKPSRLLGLPETRSLMFRIKNSPDQVEGYLDYLQLRGLPSILAHPKALHLVIIRCHQTVQYVAGHAMLHTLVAIIITLREPFPTIHGSADETQLLLIMRYVYNMKLC
jgi:hypothetical protein